MNPFLSLKTVLQKFPILHTDCQIAKVSDGLINNTWKISCGEDQYILQRINNLIFRRPQDLINNVQLLAEYLQRHYPDYLFVNHIKSLEQNEIVFVPEQGYFRLSSFVKESTTIKVVSTSDQAFEAARQFALFTNNLSGFDSEKLSIIIPDFHDLTARYDQFENSMKSGNRNRLHEVTKELHELMLYRFLVNTYKKICRNRMFKKRVIHHDAKITNVLFTSEGKGICVIDLDTVMPGYFFSDVGDMLRTYLPSVSEEEADINKIDVSEDFFKAIVQGYLSEMYTNLTDLEKTSFFNTGLFLVYMQALRFMTDYLMDDIYYAARYPDHNLVRARNQIALLKKLMEKEEKFLGIIEQELASKTFVFL